MAMHDTSRAHFHGVRVPRLFVELTDEETERVASEEGTHLEYVGLGRKRMYGTVGASAGWQAHYSQFLKGHEFVQGLSYPSLFVPAKRDV